MTVERYLCVKVRSPSLRLTLNLGLGLVLLWLDLIAILLRVRLLRIWLLRLAGVYPNAEGEGG